MSCITLQSIKFGKLSFLSQIALIHTLNMGQHGTLSGVEKHILSHVFVNVLDGFSW